MLDKNTGPVSDPQSPDFEWIKAKITDEDGSSCTRHYLVDPSGQVRGDVDEPTNGRISYIADLYFADSRYSNWISLSIAKAHVELCYLDVLKKRSPKNEIDQNAVGSPLACPEVAALAAGAASPKGAVEASPVSADGGEVTIPTEAASRGEA